MEKFCICAVEFTKKDMRLSKHIELCPPQKKKIVAQSHLMLCNPMDHSPPGFSVHGILQARTPEWVAISFSRGSS